MNRLYRLDISLLDIYRMMMRLSYYYFFRWQPIFLMSTIIKFIQHEQLLCVIWRPNILAVQYFKSNMLSWYYMGFFFGVNYSYPVYALWFSCSQRIWNYLTFQDFDFEGTWWRFFQKRVVFTTSVYVFFVSNIHICFVNTFPYDSL